MNACNRTLLALALGTCLAAPAALAQTVVGQVPVKGTGVGLEKKVPAAPVVMDADKPVERGRTEAKDAKVAGTARTATRATVATPATRVAAGAAVDAQGGAAMHSTSAMRTLWTRLDTNADGRISATEAGVDADFNTRFGALDVDKDGFISDAEFRAHHVHGTAQGAAHAAPHSAVVQKDAWTRLDANGDGKLSSVEVSADAALAGRFDALDGDNDGFVSAAEFRAGAKVEGGLGDSRGAAPAKAWSTLDVDGDGRVSATEADADAGFDSAFARMDANGDGFVTQAEHHAHAKANRKPAKR